MASRHRLGASALFENAVTPELARLIAEVCGARERARRSSSLTLADPAAAAGDLMVTQTPYRSAEDLDPFGILDFIDDAALRLTADRFAVVLGPASVLVGDLPTGPAARRAGLLKADMVEAVIRLAEDRRGHHVVLGPDEVLGTRRPGERRVDREVFASRYPNARLTQPGDVLVTMTPRPGAVIGWDGYAIAGYPVRILRIPPGEAGQFTPRVLCALLFGDGSGTRPAGAVRASGSVDERRLLLLPPGRVRAFDDLLASIDERRALAQREIGMLDELRLVATGGLVDGTLTLISDAAQPHRDVQG